jgi:hypothetical protein
VANLQLEWDWMLTIPQRLSAVEGALPWPENHSSPYLQDLQDPLATSRHRRRQVPTSYCFRETPFSHASLLPVCRKVPSAREYGSYLTYFPIRRAILRLCLNPMVERSVFYGSQATGPHPSAEMV